ncbi:4'-phosphopantetheinyl transferase superfamily protein [Brachybacterium sp. J144]|uniref:4'-phosphopantetheinyl transferase family protein n=1 Tax=Brachybacterium sp. J144 TaxID=3116487 RepID=UPI002E778808|nr:4'-phosphopantetheinyl transferase superfamily protein [Brachybacterium sp. J144]MEE1651844.1 4'-phosphopantetheinyl transferase superfamily protein [Brachybacterium sp. J144]
MDPSVRRHSSLEDADAMLRLHVAELLGVPADAVRTGRLCPLCGSSGHGRPWARVDDRPDDLVVSLSRCGEHLVTAVARGGAIGVDLESVEAVDRGWDGHLVLHPAEPEDPDRRAAVWAGKEAVLKMLGTGLTVPMTAVRLADHDMRELPAPPGHVLALARRAVRSLSPAPGPAAAAAPSPPATPETGPRGPRR